MSTCNCPYFGRFYFSHLIPDGTTWTLSCYSQDTSLLEYLNNLLSLRMWQWIIILPTFWVAVQLWLGSDSYFNNKYTQQFIVKKLKNQIPIHISSLYQSFKTFLWLFLLHVELYIKKTYSRKQYKDFKTPSQQRTFLSLSEIFSKTFCCK